MEAITVLLADYDPIALLAVPGGMWRKAAESRGPELLDLLGLGDRAQQVPAVLCGGQRQRPAIARALVNSPTLCWPMNPPEPSTVTGA